MDSGFQLSEGIQVDLEEQEELDMQRQVYKKRRSTTSYLDLKCGIHDRTQSLKVLREKKKSDSYPPPSFSDNLDGKCSRKKISRDLKKKKSIDRITIRDHLPQNQGQMIKPMNFHQYVCVYIERPFNAALCVCMCGHTQVHTTDVDSAPGNSCCHLTHILRTIQNCIGKLFIYTTQTLFKLFNRYLIVFYYKKVQSNTAETIDKVLLGNGPFFVELFTIRDQHNCEGKWWLSIQAVISAFLIKTFNIKSQLGNQGLKESRLFSQEVSPMRVTKSLTFILKGTWIFQRLKNVPQSSGPKLLGPRDQFRG